MELMFYKKSRNSKEDYEKTIDVEAEEVDESDLNFRNIQTLPLPKRKSYFGVRTSQFYEKGVCIDIFV